MATLLQSVQPMAHRIKVHHHLLAVFGQTAHPHLQQGGFNLGWIVRHLMVAAALVIGEFQTIERAGAGQGYASMRWIEPILAQRIELIAGAGQERIEPQPVMIIEIFVAQRQPINPLGQQFLHRVIDKNLVANIVEALGQRLGQPQIGIHLA